MKHKKEKRNQRSKMKLKKKNTKKVCPPSKGKVIERVWNPWDVRERKVLSPSYKRLESFLKEVGNKSPFEYSQKMKPLNDRYKKSTGYLWYMWNEVLGYIFETKEGQKRFISNDVFDWFIQLEHLITNNEMFWTLLPKIWLNRSHYITNGNESIFNRYGRMDVPFERRMECLYYLNNIGGENILREGLMTKDYIMTLFKNMDDEITLYRSFKCKVGFPIRKGVYKNNNTLSHIQEQGRGWSYSLNKSNSIFVNGLINTYYYKKYLGLNDEKSKKELKRRRHLTNDHMKDPKNYKGFFDCIGIYKVKKKDILFITDDWGECEVVLNPVNVIFENYNFLNITDLITQDFLLNLLRRLGLDRSSIHNIDGVYSVFQKVIKKNLKYYPEVIQQFLTNNIQRSKTIISWFEKYTGFKGKWSFRIDKFEHNSDMKNFGLLGVIDGSGESKMFSNSVNSIMTLPSNIKVIR